MGVGSDGSGVKVPGSKRCLNSASVASRYVGSLSLLRECRRGGRLVEVGSCREEFGGRHRGPQEAWWVGGRGAWVLAWREIRRQAFPELSRKSLDNIDLNAAEARIKQKQLYRFCGDVVKDVIDVVLEMIDVDDGTPSRPPRATAKSYRTFTWKVRAAAIFH
ncbi:hypothetical protein ON010_g15610 [Phytophthora cinnamomi]|nr:hypothetical protein ON010_g15610 [Phytophthora cinnamomi]